MNYRYNGNNNDSSKNTDQEYHYDSPDENFASPEEEPESAQDGQNWHEASYHQVTAPDEPAYTPGPAAPLYYAPSKKESPQKNVEDPVLGRRRSGLLRVVALILICAIVSAAVSVGAVNYGLRTGVLKTPPTQVTIGATPQPDISTVFDEDRDGTILTGQEIYNIATKQVVCVATYISGNNILGSSGSTYGSGFIMSEDGYIITNYHVIEAAYRSSISPTVILRDGTSYTASIIGVEQNIDVAVLKIDAAGLSPVKLGSSANMQVGETIYAVGNPRRLDYTMTDGIVSALDRDVQVDSGYTISMFQISAAVNSGNSGGPVYNAQGEVLGIVSAKYASLGTEGLGFAIPIDDVTSIVSDLITVGYVTGKAQLGVVVQTMDANSAEYYGTSAGAFVFNVTRDSCADTAGIKPGDIITKVGDTVITSTEDLKLVLRDYKAGDTASIDIYRDDSILTLEVTFDELITTAD